MTGFFTGGGASLTFGNPQDPASLPTYGNRWRGGQILEEGKVQPQTDINTGQPIIRNGKAAEQLALPLLCDGSGPAAEANMRTDERNPNDHTDTGRRVVYIKGALRFAIGDALRRVGATDLEVGGYLYMMWTGMGKTGNSKFIGRLWQVHYIRPTAGFLAAQQPAGVGAMPMQNGAPQHTGFAPTQQPVTAPPQQGWTAAQSAPVQVDWSPPPMPSAPPVPGRSDWGAAPQFETPAAAQAWGDPQAFGQMSAQQAQTGTHPMQEHAAAWSPEQHQAYGAAALASPQAPAAAPNPWGSGAETPQAPQAPYGPPQGTPQPGAPAAGNPWGQ